MTLDALWSGWRATYIADVAGRPVPGEGSLFEQILASGRPDRETYIVHRGPTCFVILNLYPYTSGHVLVLPQRAVPSLDGLRDDEHVELWATVRKVVATVEAVYRPEGINVGVNLGRAAGAGVPDHLHVHVVPRWHGDTNFMTSVAEARVLPEPIDVTWQKLVDGWAGTDLSATSEGR
jgi:ATP adenylyltransferase